MRELLEQSIRRLCLGQRVIWCVILDAEGSTPRGPGAKMAVFEDGKTLGTVGGGAVELQASQFARTVENGKAPVRTYELYSGGSAATGMVCGGKLRIGFLPLEPGSVELLQAMLAAWEGTAAGRGNRLLKLDFRPDGASIGMVPDEAFSLHAETRPSLHGPALWEADGVLHYTEPLGCNYRVYIFGGGHVSAALVPVLLPLGFPVTVIDPRAELAVPERFPGAELLRADFEPLPSSVQLTERDYAVVMTPGHEKDLTVLRQVLRSPASYIGCIGSRKKTAFVNQTLREEGFSEAELARIHAPIGLPIQARTPEEIAISIAAELILHRAEHSD